MFLNPLAVNVNSIESYNEEKITEVIEELIKKKPDIVLESNDQKHMSLADDIEQVLIERKIKGVSIKNVIDSMFGYGIIQQYIDDELVTDVWANTYNEIFIKKLGEKIKVNTTFGTEKALKEFVKRIVIMNGEKINENQAQVVCTDRKRGMRIVVAVKPLSVISPIFHIRKPATSQSLEQLMEANMLTQEEVDKLRQAVREQKSIIIAGRGGSGKTTLLGALIKEIPKEERIMLIQETFEIRPDHPDCICELVRLSDNPYIKDYSLFDLTKYGLLLSLHRMMIGELKDKEAFDFFNAIFTGHRGSMATVHSNSAEETLDRLILLMKRADTDLTQKYLEELLKNSVDMVIYMKDYKVTTIYNVEK